MWNLTFQLLSNLSTFETVWFFDPVVGQRARDADALLLNSGTQWRRTPEEVDVYYVHLDVIVNSLKESSFYEMHFIHIIIKLAKHVHV